MATGDTRLPEGTDSIISGASVDTDFSSGDFASPAPSFDNSSNSVPASGAGSVSARDTLQDAKAKVGEKTTELRTQAADKARDYAIQGRDRAVEGLDNVQRMIGDAADTIDAKVGEQYGAYIRQAADAVASFTDTLRDKDVEELLDDARSLIRKSPGLAIGAATAIGFALARIAKVGLDPASLRQAPTTGEVTPVRSEAPAVSTGQRPLA